MLKLKPVSLKEANNFVLRFFIFIPPISLYFDYSTAFFILQVLPDMIYCI